MVQQRKSVFWDQPCSSTTSLYSSPKFLNLLFLLQISTNSNLSNFKTFSLFKITVSQIFMPFSRKFEEILNFFQDFGPIEVDWETFKIRSLQEIIQRHSNPSHMVISTEMSFNLQNVQPSLLPSSLCLRCFIAFMVFHSEPSKAMKFFSPSSRFSISVCWMDCWGSEWEI